MNDSEKVGVTNPNGTDLSNNEVNAEKPVRTGRGIGTARGTTRLKFSHTNAQQNGLFLAHLEDVNVTDIKISEDTNLASFNGLSIPKITFTFVSTDAKKKYATLSFTAVESNVNTIPNGKEEWKVNQVFDYLKHILNVFVFKDRELTDEEIEMLSLPFVDFNEEGYVPVDVEEVLSGWRVLFNNVSTLLNKDKVYVDKSNKPITLWIKLIRYFRNKSGWKANTNGDLGFPSFVGEGVIEIYKPNTSPGIRLDVIKEDIKPREVKEETNKIPNLPSAGVNMNTFDDTNIGLINNTDDMPF